MSNREAKLQGRQWAEAPDILAEDLRKLISWVDEHALESVAEKDGGRMLTPRNAPEALELLRNCDSALWEYRRISPVTRVNYRMWQPLMEALSAFADGETEISFQGFSDLDDAVKSVERWAAKQAHKTAEVSMRSELLKVTIEELDGELIVRTDKDGSLKLRGTVNIPMFMAFWRAPKHRLSREAFLDINPGSTHTYLERHRTRLCAQLQDILLEVVVEGNGARLQRCRS